MVLRTQLGARVFPSPRLSASTRDPGEPAWATRGTREQHNKHLNTLVENGPFSLAKVNFRRHREEIPHARSWGGSTYFTVLEMKEAMFVWGSKGKRKVVLCKLKVHLV